METNDNPNPADPNGPSAQSAALDRLSSLLGVSGHLQLISNVHVCGGGMHRSDSDFKQDVCDAYHFPTTDPRHYVLHPVTSISEPDHHGNVFAYADPDSSQGSWTYGAPVDLLRRLQEVSNLPTHAIG